MHISTAQAVATVSLPVTVSYVCEHCGRQNRDESQVLSVSKKSDGAFLFVTDQMRQNASDNAHSAFKSMIDDMKNRDYRSARLTCKCQGCGKRQSWSSLLPKPLITAVMVVFIVAAVVLVMFMSVLLSGNATDPSPVTPIVCVLALIPFPVLKIVNGSKQKKIDALHESQLPVITVRKVKQFVPRFIPKQ